MYHFTCYIEFLGLFEFVLEFKMGIKSHPQCVHVIYSYELITTNARIGKKGPPISYMNKCLNYVVIG